MTKMNCDRIAPYYEILEHFLFGSRLEHRRFAFLGEIRTSRKALVCGGGDGRFLARLLRVNTGVEVDFVDLSSTMIELAERRVAGMGRAFRKRVRFHAGDVRSFAAPADHYDLIVTHYFLDCFSNQELEDVVGRLANWGMPQARWIVSDFREANGPIGRLWTRSVIGGLYSAFRFTTGLKVTRLPEYKAALTKKGYFLRFEEDVMAGLLHSSLWEAQSWQGGTAKSHASQGKDA
jgi:ubiquinone/menaquinone biosynthesis C-methylase UbiE